MPLSLSELVLRTSRVVQTEIVDTGRFTPQFIAMDPCGQLSVFTLTPAPADPVALAGYLQATLDIVQAYNRCFQPTALVLTLDIARHLPLTLGFEVAGDQTRLALGPEITAMAPDLQAKAKLLFGPLIEVFHVRPANAEERAAARAFWQYLTASIVPAYRHPSIGNN